MVAASGAAQLAKERVVLVLSLRDRYDAAVEAYVCTKDLPEIRGWTLKVCLWQVEGCLLDGAASPTVGRGDLSNGREEHCMG